jgi:hypothetical protein
MSAPKRFVVEDDVPLSRSILWELQRRFYLGRGPRAWAGGEVPSWITSNPLIGGFYAELVITWAIEGLHAQPKTVRNRAPVVVLELGAGPGLLAYRFLCRLTELSDIWSPLGLSFKYIMSDLAPSNVAFWSAHPQLAPFFESGILSVAKYDPLADGAAVYPEAARPLVAGSTPNPVVVLANYFFDSIPTDLVKVHDGQAWVARLTTTAPEKLDPRPDPSVIADLTHEWSWRAYEDAPYSDSTVDEIVRFYAEAIDDAHFPFPVSGFETLGVLDELSAGRLLLLTADKGANHLSRFGGSEHQNIVRHGDGFSFDANPEALGRWFVAKGGFVLHNDPGSQLSITAATLGSSQPQQTSLTLAWRRAVDARDPSEFYPHLKVFIDQDGPLDGKLFITLLRESAWDPYIVSTLHQRVSGMLRKLKQRHRRRLIEGLRRAWRNYFPIGEKQDVAFLFGTIAFEVEHWKDARTWFHASVQQHGDGPAALHNIGLTLAKVDRWADALPWFQRALTAQRDYAPAAKFLGLAERVIEAEAEAGQIQGDVVVPSRADDADPNASSEE